MPRNVPQGIVADTGKGGGSGWLERGLGELLQFFNEGASNHNAKLLAQQAAGTSEPWDTGVDTPGLLQPPAFLEHASSQPLDPLIHSTRSGGTGKTASGHCFGPDGLASNKRQVPGIVGAEPLSFLRDVTNTSMRPSGNPEHQGHASPPVLDVASDHGYDQTFESNVSGFDGEKSFVADRGLLRGNVPGSSMSGPSFIGMVDTNWKTYLLCVPDGLDVDGLDVDLQKPSHDAYRGINNSGSHTLTSRNWPAAVAKQVCTRVVAAAHVLAAVPIQTSECAWLHTCRRPCTSQAGRGAPTRRTIRKAFNPSLKQLAQLASQHGDHLHDGYSL
eukprot:365228-Chlamydomonas_euryale.AAC.22